MQPRDALLQYTVNYTSTEQTGRGNYGTRFGKIHIRSLVCYVSLFSPTEKQLI